MIKKSARRMHTPAFKAKVVALAALREDKLYSSHTSDTGRNSVEVGLL